MSHSNTQNLVHMANQIGQFYEALPNRQEGLEGIAGHLRKFWDPRMRRELLAYIDEKGGDGLRPMVREAIELKRRELTPAS
jgi:formate dehydrogenase subunit delta